MVDGFWKLKKLLIFARDFAGVAQLVEHDLAKVGVAGSSPVSRSIKQKVSFQAPFFFYSILRITIVQPDPNQPAYYSQSIARYFYRSTLLL